MSQTHGGNFSGARPTQEYSACGNSQTHITLGAPSSILQQQQQQQYPAHQYAHQQHHHQQARHHLQSHGAFEARENRSFLEPGLGGPSTGAAESNASPEDFLFPPQVYDNSMLLREQGEQDHDDHDEFDGDDGDNNSQGSGKRSRTRRPHLQGRFSGRLTTKEDERRLAEECKLLGPLLGGVGKRGDKSRLTLAKIVRGIATGDVRRFCEERERAIAMLRQKLMAIDPEAAASVPINSIALPSNSLGGMGMGGSMGGPSSMGSMGVHGQVEAMQRDNSELQHEVFSLRTELQARERLLLELQDTGIISGFVPTSIALDEPQQRALPHHSGAAGGGGGRGPAPDMAPPPPYGMPPRNQSYGQPHMGPYGGPSQMSMPQSSGMELAGGPPLGGNMAGSLPLAPLQPPGASTHGGGDTASLGPMQPAMSEHSRASRPLKRPLGGGPGGLGGGELAEVARSMSHPAGGRGGGYPHIDLQQQLNSLQAQVEQLQNMSSSSRGPATLLMPARERSGPPIRMSTAPQFGGGAGGMGSPFISGGPQGGMMMLPGGHAPEGGAPFHPGMGGPLHLQAKPQAGNMYDMGGARDPRGGGGQGGGGGRHGVPDAEYGLDSLLAGDHINSRAMRGEYDLPLELLMPEGGRGGGGGGGPGPQ